MMPRYWIAPIAAALGVAAAAGCATRSAEIRPTPASAAIPPELVEVESSFAAAAPGDPAIRPASDEAAADASIALAPAAATPPPIPEATPPRLIDLSSALRLADGQNPVIGEARVLILAALAQRTAARSLLLPSLNAGLNYHDHVGPQQRSVGTILPLTEQSFYYGGGTNTLGANTIAIPAVNIASPLTDAIFEPLAAQQRVVGTRFNAAATANSTLLDVARLYLDLVGNEAVLAIRRELAVEADRIASEVAAYAETGQGRHSDAERADADRRLFQAAIQRAEEDAFVSSAQLAERLTLDPSSRLRPVAGPIEPVELIDANAPVELLIRSAMARRPDLSARDALAMEAQYLAHREKARPFLPTIWLGFSAGSFGGGSDLVTPDLGRYDGRTDFDVRAYWTLLNFGVGNSALIKQRNARFNQALAERTRVLNQIRDEVATARAESLAARSRVEVARIGLRTAEDGYRQDRDRLRETVGRPIEALDSLRLLADARVALVRAIIATDRAQFALFVSLGAPPPLDVPLDGHAPGLPPTQ
ncbi:TolC family protein [Tundrisphaera sp. TA3]|uniref:TolC family protein n=1 Tax=Tundrisphaera sp. TA3 TaxID=3435775 RepID=UPI003EBEE065